jgi:hypothetical protein
LNLLGGGLSRTSQNNPLQRNEKHPLHTLSPDRNYHIKACTLRLLAIEDTGTVLRIF